MANPTKTAAEWEAENAALRAQLATMATQPVRQITFDIGQKGGILLRGVNAKFPVNLYVEQAERLFGSADKADDLGMTVALKEFIRTNRKLLSTKSSPKLYTKNPLSGKEFPAKAA